MKKYIAFSLSLLLALALMGCGAEEEISLTQPPALTVRYNDESVTAILGTYAWNLPTKDGGIQNILADAAHTLDAKNDVPVLTLSPAPADPTDSEVPGVLLQFEVNPDILAVYAWPADAWGNTEAPFTPIDLSVYDDAPTYKAALMGLDAIYEVHAEWNSYDAFSGQAYYAFTTAAK